MRWTDGTPRLGAESSWRTAATALLWVVNMAIWVALIWLLAP